MYLIFIYLYTNIPQVCVCVFGWSKAMYEFHAASFNLNFFWVHSPFGTFHSSCVVFGMHFWGWHSRSLARFPPQGQVNRCLFFFGGDLVTLDRCNKTRSGSLQDLSGHHRRLIRKNSQQPSMPFCNFCTCGVYVSRSWSWSCVKSRERRCPPAYACCLPKPGMWGWELTGYE